VSQQKKAQQACLWRKAGREKTCPPLQRLLGLLFKVHLLPACAQSVRAAESAGQPRKIAILLLLARKVEFVKYQKLNELLFYGTVLLYAKKYTNNG